MKDLSKYHTIGWDFDGTLVDHARSQDFADYILANPHGQKFYIVTFRSHGMQYDVDRDMEYLGLTREHFEGVLNIPNILYERYYQAHLGFGRESLKDAIVDYHCWKGRTCKDIGAGLLVDDMFEQVIMGCQECDIDYAHPDDVIIP